jgi:uncharacterized membrane protein
MAVAGTLQTADERHPRPDTAQDLLRSATLGFVAGLRSMLPLALLADRLGREGPDIADGGWAVDLLTARPAAVVLGLAAAGEVLADKLPRTPSRVAPLPLAGRVVLGGTTCALQSLAEGRASDSGARVGALGAVAGSVVGYTARTRLSRLLPLPGVLVALIEDGLAWWLGRWAIQS